MKCHAVTSARQAMSTIRETQEPFTSLFLLSLSTPNAGKISLYLSSCTSRHTLETFSRAPVKHEKLRCESAGTVAWPKEPFATHVFPELTCQGRRSLAPNRLPDGQVLPVNTDAILEQDSILHLLRQVSELRQRSSTWQALCKSNSSLSATMSRQAVKHANHWRKTCSRQRKSRLQSSPPQSCSL